MVPSDRDRVRLAIIVEIAELVQDSVRGVTLDAFVADRLLVDATAYRLGSIGEHTGKLADAVKDRHPDVQWRRAYDMRNALFHDYEWLVPALLFDVTRRPLDLLLAACRAELARAD